MGTEEKTMTQEDLVALIGKTIKESGPAVAQQVFAEMKSEANKGEMKKIFPHFGEEGDLTGGTLKSRSGNVLDFSAFRKAGSRTQTDAEFASSLVSIGGPVSLGRESRPSGSYPVPGCLHLGNSGGQAGRKGRHGAHAAPTAAGGRRRR